MFKKYPTNDFENFSPFKVENKKVNLIKSFKDHIVKIKRRGFVLIKTDDVWRSFSNSRLVRNEIKMIEQKIEKLEMTGGGMAI